MTQNEVLKLVSKEVKKLSHDDAAHDWWHIHRVNELAKKICKKENGDEFVVSMIALLHDMFDWKFNKNGVNAENELRSFLDKIGVAKYVDDYIVGEVCYCAANLGWSENMFGQKNELSLNGKIAQDADRLDAIGAIGIARTMMFQGKKGRVLYNPNVEIHVSKTKEDYQVFHDNLHGLNHFYEKLLRIRDYMNTKTGEKLANGRHKFMEDYLDEFYKEWEGER